MTQTREWHWAKLPNQDANEGLSLRILPTNLRREFKRIATLWSWNRFLRNILYEAIKSRFALISSVWSHPSFRQSFFVLKVRTTAETLIRIAEKTMANRDNHNARNYKWQAKYSIEEMSSMRHETRQKVAGGLRAACWPPLLVWFFIQILSCKH